MKSNQKENKAMMNPAWEWINVSGKLKAQFRKDYECVVCQGRGHLFEEDERGISTMRDCECTLLQKRLQRLTAAGIPGKFQSAKFETYHPMHASQKMALRTAQDFVKDFGGDSMSLILMGTPGLGKTHLAVSIIKELILQYGADCKFVDFFQLLSDIRFGYSQDMSEQAILNPYVNARVLVIDELAKGRNTEWELTMLDQIISSRYNAADKISIFTTNYSDQSATSGRTHESGLGVVDTQSYAGKMAATETLQDKIGSRMYSRLVEMCHFLRMEGEDYRQAMATGTRPQSKKAG